MYFLFKVIGISIILALLCKKSDFDSSDGLYVEGEFSHMNEEGYLHEQNNLTGI